MMDAQDLDHVTRNTIPNEIRRFEHAQNALPVAMRTPATRKIFKEFRSKSNGTQDTYRPFRIRFLGEPSVDVTKIV